VKPGVVSDLDLMHIRPDANEANPKSILREDDIVVVRTGNAGSAARVPAWAAGGNAVDLLIVRRSPTLDSGFLEAVLNSNVVRVQIAKQSVGALQAHFNVESLGNLLVPVATNGQQVETLAAIETARSRANGLAGNLRREIELLIERRLALISTHLGGPAVEEVTA
jgi:type I restriction enzyme, S subunit